MKQDQKDEVLKIFSVNSYSLFIQTQGMSEVSLKKWVKLISGANATDI